MENFSWLSPLKCAVLVMFFLTYAALVAIVATQPVGEDYRDKELP